MQIEVYLATNTGFKFSGTLDTDQLKSLIELIEKLEQIPTTKKDPND